MKTELFKKVYIKSESDLPKEDGTYFVHDKIGLMVNNFSKSFAHLWMNDIDWYLLPIEQDTDINTPFFGNSGARIPVNESVMPSDELPIVIHLNKYDLNESYYESSDVFDFCEKHKIKIEEPKNSKGLYNKFIITLETPKQKMLFSGKYIDRLEKIAKQVKPIDLDPDIIEQIFKNAERMHGKSEALDWIKIAAHRTVEYFKNSNQ